MVSSRRYKYVVLLFLCFVIIFLFFIKHDIKFLNQVSSENLVLNVLINKDLCSYDEDKNVFYYYSENKNFNSWDFKFNSLHDLNYYIKSIDNNVLVLRVFDEKYYQDVSIVVTQLPIIDLHDLDLNRALNSNNFFKKNIYSFSNMDDDLFFDDISYYYTKFNDGYKSKYIRKVGLKVRGTSSTLYPKKSYKISFDNKLELYDLSKDDKYVLDALYIDSSKIRNLLSTDLWNLINNNQQIQNDLHGNFVELFIDNKYMGLYVIKEKVDKSVTKISDDGILLKAFGHLLEQHIISFLNAPHIIDNGSIINFEIKKYNRSTFNLFSQKMYNFFTSEKSYDLIADTYYMDNYLNYKIFVSLISGDDNLSSNQYYSMVDSSSKILITPWDMDLTWGLYWNYDSYLHSEFLFDKNYNYDWLNNNIVNDMDEKTLLLLRQRYWELRKDVINIDTINEFLNSYSRLLISSGAIERDGNVWYQYNIEFEINRIREWANYRIQFLDKYFE